jgi:hypothetical protein
VGGDHRAQEFGEKAFSDDFFPFYGKGLSIEALAKDQLARPMKVNEKAESQDFSLALSDGRIATAKLPTEARIRAP